MSGRSVSGSEGKSHSVSSALPRGVVNGRAGSIPACFRAAALARRADEKTRVKIRRKMR